MTSIEEKIKSAAEKAIVHSISSGNWIKVDYSERTSIPTELMKDVWNLVDHNKIKKQLAERIEKELADKIINHIAAEISTDIKKLLSVSERREALRSVARENLDRICSGGKE